MNSREWIRNIRDNGGQLGVFEKYKLEERPLAEGGFSKIYLATRDGYQYAMKIPKIIDADVSESISVDQETINLFRGEMERWALVSNVIPDSVVCLLDYGMDPFPWMVMELAAESLEHAIETGSASFDDFKDMLESLKGIHGIRMSHLDIKPENVLRVDGRWKFSDFGLSGFYTEDIDCCAIRGTVRYMAPEQFNPRGAPRDSRTDVWQMGVILYRMVSRREPYSDVDPDAIPMEIVRGGPDISDIGEPYRPVLKKALSLDMDSRYRDASEMLEAMRDISAGRVIDPEPVKHSDAFERALALYSGYERKDFEEAYRLFREDGSTLSRAFACMMLNDGSGVRKDMVAAMDEAAEVLPELSGLAGADPVASYLLGCYYSDGLGVDVDDEFAFVNTKRSADAGFPPALHLLAWMYGNGVGTGEDMKSAVLCTMRAAKSGYTAAMGRLGQLYLGGNDYVDSDPAKALQLFEEAASRGDGWCNLYAGLMYTLGQYFPPEPEKGAKYLLEAHRRGIRDESFQVFDQRVLTAEFVQDREHINVAVVTDGVEEIGDNAFADCSSLVLVSLPPTLRYIGSKAFYRTPLRGLDLPDSVEEIGSEAFYYCQGLSHARFGRGLARIGADSFRVSGLEELILPDTVKEIGVKAFRSSHLRSVEMPGVVTIGNGAFGDCQSLKYVTTGENLETVAEDAFYGCSSLIDVDIRSARYIGNYAFRTCQSLRSVDVSGAEELGDGCFLECSNLSDIRFGPGLRKFGTNIVGGSKVRSLTVPGSAKYPDYSYKDMEIVMMD